MAEAYNSGGQRTIGRIDTKITVGNIITIALLLFSMVMAYSKLATKDEVQQGLDSIKKEYVSREVNTLQLQMITNQVHDLSAKVEEMAKDVTTRLVHL